jgi:hypothetical protein
MTGHNRIATKRKGKALHRVLMVVAIIAALALYMFLYLAFCLD